MTILVWALIAFVIGSVIIFGVVIYLYRRHMVIRWDAKVPRVECSRCGGSGALRLVRGRAVKIPRSEWDKALWTMANIKDCRECHGLGHVPGFDTPHRVSVLMN